MSEHNIKLIIESKIPFVQGLLDSYADVRYLAPEEIDANAVSDADGIIIRTRTQCNASLLEGSRVKFIATATIGTDHIDADYCRTRGIKVVNAPGCNAPAVAQYVFASLLQVINRPLKSYTIGIVGVGNVGSIVSRWAESFEMKVLRCDPPRQRTEGGYHWYSLDSIATNADIITFHTPLSFDGIDKTYHLADETFFSRLRRAPIIINCARGGIANDNALVSARVQGMVSKLIIDCWENEPELNRELLQLADIATPHIAGYSLEGKLRASQMALNAACEFFKFPKINISETLPPIKAPNVAKRDIYLSYNPLPESNTLKRHPENFEKIRNSYPLRHETPAGKDPH